MDWKHSPARTNQKIQFARVQLESLQYFSAANNRGETSQRIQLPENVRSDLVLATCESVAQHLRGAWRALMVEIAGAYGVVLEYVDHPQALIDALARGSIVSPEAKRMLALQSMPGGWVVDMLALADGIDRPDHIVPLTASITSESEDTELAEADIGCAVIFDGQLAMLRGCLEALEGFVDATRIAMMEW